MAETLINFQIIYGEFFLGKSLEKAAGVIQGRNTGEFSEKFLKGLHDNLMHEFIEKSWSRSPGIVSNICYNFWDNFWSNPLENTQ